MLVPQQNLVNIIRMRRVAGEMVSQNLKDVPEAARVINIDIGDELIALPEEGHLQVSKMIVGLETVSILEPFETWGEVVQPSVNLVEQPGVDAVYHFFPKFLLNKCEKSISA